MTVRIATIGFTKKSAEHFFGLLRDAGVARVVDIRLHNSSQLAGFSKRDDLEYFLHALGNIGYVHLPELAPTAAMLATYGKQRRHWAAYEQSFLDLMAQRRIEETIPRELLDGGCLLCSEHRPDHCHRRLVVEYLARHWENVEVTHLM